MASPSIGGEEPPQLLARGGLPVSRASRMRRPWSETMADEPSDNARRGENKQDLQRDDRGKGHAPQRSKQDLDRELDKALQDSFPSSDPPATSQPTKSEPAGDPDVKP
jgi:hypothetical protein